MRWEVLRLFSRELESAELQQPNIAILGGNKNDPESFVVESLFGHPSVTYLGIENSPEIIFFDLNLDNIEERKFDLVICSQVIEHIWNQGNFFVNLDKLTKKGAYIWISCPYNNHTHGSPDYFSAGFSANYLVKNLESRYEVLSFKEFGSKRYFVSSLLRDEWMSEDEHRFPMKTNVVKGKSLKYAIYHYLRFDLLWLIVLTMLSPKIRTDRFKTETVLWARKR